MSQYDAGATIGRSLRDAMTDVAKDRAGVAPHWSIHIGAPGFSLTLSGQGDMPVAAIDDAIEQLKLLRLRSERRG